MPEKRGVGWGKKKLPNIEVKNKRMLLLNKKT